MEPGSYEEACKGGDGELSDGKNCDPPIIGYRQTYGPGGETPIPPEPVYGECPTFTKPKETFGKGEGPDCVGEIVGYRQTIHPNGDITNEPIIGDCPTFTKPPEKTGKEGEPECPQEIMAYKVTERPPHERIVEPIYKPCPKYTKDDSSGAKGKMGKTGSNASKKCASGGRKGKSEK